MKAKRLRRLVDAILDARETRVDATPVVTFRTVSICFPERTVTIDGHRIEATTDCLDFPILSGSAIFIAKSDMERVA